LYDPLGRLWQTSGPSGTARFQYDGAAIIAEYDGSGVMQHRWVHGPGMDEPLVRYDGSGLSNKRWLHADERGSIIAHTNTSGSRIQTNTYDPYGTPGASNAGLFQYTGQVWLEDAGVYYYKKRTYHAELGRFMQADPIGHSGGVNLYAYVSGDPVNFTDPWGLSRLKDECMGTKTVTEWPDGTKTVEIVWDNSPACNGSGGLGFGGGIPGFGGGGNKVGGGGSSGGGDSGGEEPGKSDPADRDCPASAPTGSPGTVRPIAPLKTGAGDMGPQGTRWSFVSYGRIWIRYHGSGTPHAESARVGVRQSQPGVSNLCGGGYLEIACGGAYRRADTHVIGFGHTAAVDPAFDNGSPQQWDIFVEQGLPVNDAKDDVRISVYASQTRC
jgi:RHS repeat-associated protein